MLVKKKEAKLHRRELHLICKQLEIKLRLDPALSVGGLSVWLRICGRGTGSKCPPRRQGN